MNKESRPKLILGVNLIRFAVVFQVLVGLAGGLGAIPLLLLSVLALITGLVFLAGQITCLLNDDESRRNLLIGALLLEALCFGAGMVSSTSLVALGAVMLLLPILQMISLTLVFLYLASLSKGLNEPVIASHFQRLVIILWIVAVGASVAGYVLPPPFFVLVIMSAGIIALAVVISFSGAAANLVNALKVE